MRDDWEKSSRFRTKTSLIVQWVHTSTPLKSSVASRCMGSGTLSPSIEAELIHAMFY
jgi:hypothetical protein